MPHQWSTSRAKMPTPSGTCLCKHDQEWEFACCSVHCRTTLRLNVKSINSLWVGKKSEGIITKEFKICTVRDVSDASTVIAAQKSGVCSEGKAEITPNASPAPLRWSLRVLREALHNVKGVLWLEAVSRSALLLCSVTNTNNRFELCFIIPSGWAHFFLIQRKACRNSLLRLLHTHTEASSMKPVRWHCTSIISKNLWIAGIFLCWCFALVSSSAMSVVVVVVVIVVRNGRRLH